MTSTAAKRGRRDKLGRRVDSEREALGYSVCELAKKAGFSERTVRDFLKGKTVLPNTKLVICKAVGIDIRNERSLKGREQIQAADSKHGAYTRDLFHEYLGCFFAYRRSFQNQSNVIRSLYEFFWSTETKCLCFKEIHKYYSPRLGRTANYNQEGEVFFSHSIGLVHLLTEFEGALRLITLTRLHHDEKTMSGIVLTQSERPSHFVPATSPIYLRKANSGTPDDLAKRVGIVEPGDPDFQTINSLLQHIEKNVGCFGYGPALEQFSRASATTSSESDGPI